MKKVSDYFYLKTSLIGCLVLTAAMVLYAWLVMGSQSKCIPDGISLLGLRLGYTYKSVIDLFSTLNQDSLNCYNKLLKIWDNIFPFFYGSMYIFWLSLIFKKHKFRKKGLKLVNLYPLLPMTLDFIENHFERKLITRFILENNVLEMNVKIASIATQTKWTLSAINYILILTGLILLIKRTIKR